MKLSYIKTLSQAKAHAERLGYTTEERDGRLFYYKNGKETGSTLIDGFTPEPTVSEHAVARIIEEDL
jgi:hypothetical protein